MNNIKEKVAALKAKGKKLKSKPSTEAILPPTPPTEAPAQPEQPPQNKPIGPIGKLNAEMNNRGRLPVGSTFHLTYCAPHEGYTTGYWYGVLNVPTGGSFRAKRSGVFRVLQQLDDYYRLYEAKQKKKQEKKQKENAA